MSVSVVILNYNKKEYTIRNIKKCLSIKLDDDEIIVVDNASSDGSVQAIEEFEPQIKFIKSKKNLGVCGGRNLGFKKAQYETVIYLDDDALPTDDLFIKTEAYFKNNEKVGCIAYRIQHMPDCIVENNLNSEDVLHYHGAGHAFKKSALEKIGYLDETMFFGAQEIESSLRLRLAGYSIKYLDELTVYHYSFPPSGGKQIVRMIESSKSWSFFYAKYFPLKISFIFVCRRYLRLISSSRKKGFGFLSISNIILSGIIRYFKTIIGPREILKGNILSDYTDPLSKPSFDNVPVFKKR